jgi:glycosyltransferase involved in cell wall biosynthesis
LVSVDLQSIGTRLALVIPAFNEEECIATVVSGFRAVTDAEIVVVDNNSSDATAQRATEAGAKVIHESRPGYGSACLGGLRYLKNREQGPPEVVAFADGDGANEASELGQVVSPVLSGQLDMIIGSRPKKAEPNSLTLPQRFGNRLACFLIRVKFGVAHSDLGPYRAISWAGLEQIEMQDPDYGWTVEMQVKAAKHRLRVDEVDVRNYARIGGKSKISGTAKGVYLAGTKIISTILRYR